jgi:hypothetical protein
LSVFFRSQIIGKENGKMSSKHILTIKDWSGSGTGNLDIEVGGGFGIIEKQKGNRRSYKLIVNRKHDQYSSRFGMMASLNQRNNTLSWGFLEVTLTVKKYSDTGVFLSVTAYSFHGGVAVAEARTVNNNEQEVTFVSNLMGDYCVGKC